MTPKQQVAQRSKELGDRARDYSDALDKGPGNHVTVASGDLHRAAFAYVRAFDREIEQAIDADHANADGHDLGGEA